MMEVVEKLGLLSKGKMQSKNLMPQRKGQERPAERGIPSFK
jgi:hypothetical protein